MVYLMISLYQSEISENDIKKFYFCEIAFFLFKVATLMMLTQDKHN